MSISRIKGRRESEIYFARARDLVYVFWRAEMPDGIPKWGEAKTAEPNVLALRNPKLYPQWHLYGGRNFGNETGCEYRSNNWVVLIRGNYRVVRTRSGWLREKRENHDCRRKSKRDFTHVRVFGRHLRDITRKSADICMGRLVKRIPVLGLTIHATNVWVVFCKTNPPARSNDTVISVRIFRSPFENHTGDSCGNTRSIWITSIRENTGAKGIRKTVEIISVSRETTNMNLYELGTLRTVFSECFLPLSRNFT